MIRNRHGVTLVEQVMALAILSIGLLAISAAGDMLHRGARHALRRAEVIAAAAAWRERLAAAACAGASAGVVDSAGIRVSWRTEPLGAARVITVRAEEVVASPAPGAREAVHETIGAARCAGG